MGDTSKLRSCSLVASYAVYMVCCFVPVWLVQRCKGLRRPLVQYDGVSASAEDADVIAAMAVDIDNDSASSDSDACEAEPEHSGDAVA